MHSLISCFIISFKDFCLNYDCIYTFVAVDETGKPVEIPQIIPETALEKERFESALRRKQLSLILAGKMDPSKATEIKALFK